MFAYGMTYVLVAGLAIAPLGDGDGDGVGVSSDYTGYIISAKRLPRPGSAAPAGKGSKVRCTYQPWFADGRENGGLEFVDPGSNLSSEPTGKGAYYLVECSDGYRDVVWIKKRRGALTPEQLARRAYKLIPIAPPTVLTAPPRGQDGLVGLPQWFFLADGQWTPKSKRLHIGAVWAAATATPERMTISTGDGQTLTCDGPGTAYDTTRPADQQSSTCSHTYQHPASAYRVTVSVTWSGTWRGSGGTGGTLPPITKSVTFPIRVIEAQALVTKG
ncbi:hypothetical protein OHB01_12745 [Microbispora hainanensis]|uniref:hypothetical protein n=1 Tax=Microbispora hainanensis TaxID=568844 RepID=UPI002E291B5B|nr:hypothetical protein [Microbispora hainanensis]